MIRLLKIYLTLTFLLVTTFCMAQKSELKFSKDGKFKIVQFTDVHFKYGNRASDIALERINQVLDDDAGFGDFYRRCCLFCSGRFRNVAGIGTGS